MFVVVFVFVLLRDPLPIILSLGLVLLFGAGSGMQHVLTLTGTGFTSTNLDDYSISVGGTLCSPTAVTTTEVRFKAIVTTHTHTTNNQQTPQPYPSHMTTIKWPLFFLTHN